ncbi:MAG: cyclic pyranopterin monophosphate synthase MoaC [Methanothrix sp.]|nr:cyclic pyranopterin monophosphate synthase MoaC [Methanothrix sp.]
MSELSHIDTQGNARMVDVSQKPDTERVARATGQIRMQPETLAAIRGNLLAKGDVLTVARIAGVLAAKHTSDLIPLCHPLPLTDVQVVLTPDDAIPGLHCEATARTVGKTGVEMEAITAVAIALVTVYDMAKAIDRGMSISDIRLLEKAGGRSGHWRPG